MITFFTIPKPFDGQYQLLQDNAIRSWMTVVPEAQVVMFGDDEGIVEAGQRLGVEVVRGVNKSSFGTPFLDEVFQLAHETARYDRICFINTDIILLHDFLKSVNAVRKLRFLMIGCRYDIDVKSEVFVDAEIEREFRSKAVRTYTEDGMYGSDYFLFTRTTGFRQIPNFIVGRPGWDNWMIFRGRMMRVPVIDASRSVFCVHQNHCYSHVERKQGPKWDGPEADHNLSLFTKSERFSLIDASHRLESGRLVLNFSPKHRQRLLTTLQKTHPELMPVFRLVWWLAASKNRLLRRNSG